MHLDNSTHRKKVIRKNNESGFVLILALVGIIILLAVGYFALTVSTGDLRIAARIAGERKAFSAAESAFHILCRNFDPATFTALQNQVIDADDPHSTYDIDAPHPPTSINIPGSLPVVGFTMSSGQEWSQKTYETTITGKNSDYGSTASMGVGFGYFDSGNLMYQ